MRIVSQDGMSDLPYNRIGICINYKTKRDIIAYPAGTYTPDDEYWVLATYSTEQKTIKAMGMLHDIYESYSMYKLMDNKQRAMTEMSLPRNQLIGVHGVFRFPQDDELEVYNG